MSMRARPQTAESEKFSLTSVERAADYCLRLTFTDGVVRIVDFGPFLRASPHPSIRAYLEPARFLQFKVEDGFLHWNDFELVFPMTDLREGRIS
jgi:hypothetical protein